jgi:diaminohydroxyphosphoribosylaminopyrimidine deaminase / 5-amino-6-(5-phosphoribosylamino)uracil reductase
MPQDTHGSRFDQRMMAYALRIGERGLGRTWPNPSVGCVLVRDGRILATARTANGGRPHAETQALHMAGTAARGATAYVTLEPCAHHGDTPPCAQALIDAGVERVVVACPDPDTRVAGKGIALLQQAGIATETGVLEQEAQQHHAGFFSRLHNGKPLLDMKLATSLDGKITNAVGESQWITGTQARDRAHALRARYDAILTGIGTVLADDPALTCRLDGLENHSPIRVVVDSHLRLPPDSQLAKTAGECPVWVLTTQPKNAKTAALEAQGVVVTSLPAAEGRVDMDSALRWLGEQGITRVLTEAGGTLNGSLWQGHHVSRLYWFRAPIALGSAGTDALAAHIATPPSDLHRLHREDVIGLGSDLLEIYSTH